MARVWLITGCSSGFGEQLTREVLSRGDKVIATARNSSRLDALKSAGADVLELDMTLSSLEMQEVAKKAIAIHGHIDVLVNNAGSVLAGAIEELSTEEWSRQFQTNFFGHVNLTTAVLPHMRERRSGTIVFVSSVAAWTVFPAGAAYNTTKAALSMLSETLSVEVESFGIKVCNIEPGYFRTPLPEKAKSATPMAAYDNTVVGQSRDLLAYVEPYIKGDLKKGCRAIVDVLTGKGGREVPTRLLLGNDAAVMVKGRCEAVLQGVEDFKPVLGNTDIDEA
ncbi:putative oxidoreductase,short chain dehydrogenase [Elsinoe ampelina]|uniref:Putative oxidoreductase,short chain dehydrogenase n=1 Tax=Elsinoe ampelina TaxID=302913 RepID=A0A6A6GBW9_9PEZI|nr:putative oxidoreductase,short chain dehydrogenase [Elsinoe ampelina]